MGKKKQNKRYAEGKSCTAQIGNNKRKGSKIKGKPCKLIKYGKTKEKIKNNEK